VPFSGLRESDILSSMDEPEDISSEIVAEKPKDRFLPISILIAAVIVSGAVVFSALYRPALAPTAGGPAVPDNSGTPPVASTAEAMKIGSRDEVIGSPSAHVTIIEYGDYQCPFCTKFFTETQSLIVKNYVNTGKAKMVFRNFAFLGPESVAAAAAAECAFDQKKMWAYHDALYQSKVDDEANGGSENDGSLNRALFLNIAKKVGINVPVFTSCIDSNKYAGLVAQEKADAAAVGINSTPSFFINGTPVQGAQPYGQFQTVIDAALKG